METSSKNGSSGKARTRRQLVDDAKRASLDGDWTGALRLNTEIGERFSPDAEVFNRRGRALNQQSRYGEAFEAYQEALRLDPANMIARRNLQRLETLRGRSAPTDNGEASPFMVTIPRPHVFIEEVGKTWSGELVNPIDMDTLSETSSGQQLDVVVDDGRLYAATPDGKRLGEFETDTARRVIALMEGGNRYEIYALGVSASSLRVILRETYRDPDQATRVSFQARSRRPVPTCASATSYSNGTKRTFSICRTMTNPMTTSHCEKPARSASRRMTTPPVTFPPPPVPTMTRTSSDSPSSRIEEPEGTARDEPRG